MNKILDVIREIWSNDERNGLPYSGKAVREAIQEKLAEHEETFREKGGAFFRTTDKQSDGAYHILLFASQSEKNEWLETKDSGLVLDDISLPDESGMASTTVVSLKTSSPTSIISTDNTVKLLLKFTSQVYNPLDKTATDTGEQGTLTVQTRPNTDSSWSTKGTFGIASAPADTDRYTEFDITALTAQGAQQVRVFVQGKESVLGTNFITFSVTKTALRLSFANTWEVPQSGDGISLSYWITGAVDKRLRIRTTGSTGLREFAYELGMSTYTETPYTAYLSDAGSTNLILKHGIHTFEAWLEAGTTESDHVNGQIIYLEDGVTSAQPMVVFNSVNDHVVNWTTGLFAEYACYRQGASSDDEMQLEFTFANRKGDVVYLHQTAVARNGERRQLTGGLEIDSEADTVDVYMTVTCGGETAGDVVGFEVDNSERFAPTRGADFVFNPKNRSNTDADRGTVINDATGSEVESVLTGFSYDTDGYVDTDLGKCFRVLAGQSVHIKYDPLKAFAESGKSSVTIGIDFCPRNVTDEETPIVSVCSTLPNGNPLGLEMKPMEACFMTLANQVRDDQRTRFEEGVRQHFDVNIVYNVGNTGRNYIRFFVNGHHRRTFAYDESDTFLQVTDGSLGSGGIRIGSEGAEIDIFRIEVYKTALSEANIRQNYIASMATIDEKRTERDRNDIVGDNGSISYEKAKLVYPTLLWRPSESTGKSTRLPKYGDTKKTTFLGDLVVADPTGRVNTGIIHDLPITGQGTSSMSYWRWNFQGKWGEQTVYNDEEGNARTGYALMDGMPEATKLCGKINWASSMQCNKMGTTALFDDLYRIVVGDTYVTDTEGFGNCRTAVRQMPFLLFEQQEDGGEAVFAGLCTFGPAKGDKPTFGYDKAVFPDYIALEGADNGAPLVNHKVPWNSDIVEEEEEWTYNGATQWELMLGAKNQIGKFIDRTNFIYRLSPNILPYDGSYTQLCADGKASKDRMYWVTMAESGSAKYDLYRWDYLTSSWVDAGVDRLEGGGYEKLNINEQCGSVASGIDYDATNRIFISWRVAEFANGIGDFVHVRDVMFRMMFDRMIAAKDNRAKNTYERCFAADDKIGSFADDYDTILPLDNVGKDKVPYYALEYMKAEDGTSYWNAYDNAFYRLMEMAYPNELRSMMHEILSAMASLGGTPMGCMKKYYFDTLEKEFPAVAYNETARIWYEAADAAMGRGEYQCNTAPLTQSLGDQLHGMREFARKRMVFLSSYAGYGEFDRGEVSGALSFRSVTRRDGSNPIYSFTLTPHQWLYPAIGAGDSVLYGAGNEAPVLCKAGETVTLDGITADGNTNIRVLGINYYRSIGHFGDKPLADTFQLSGERLTEFDAGGDGMQEFRPNAMRVTAPNLKRIDVTGVSSLTGRLDLTAQTRLMSVKAKGTGLTEVAMPGCVTLATAHLPAGLTKLELTAQPSLSDLSLESTTNLTVVRLSTFDSTEIARSLYDNYVNGRGSLQQFSARGVKWDGIPAAMMKYYAFLAGCELAGEIGVDKSDSVDFSLKLQLLLKFGDVDGGTDGLKVTYRVVPLTAVEVQGPVYLRNTKDKQYGVRPTPLTANNVTGFRLESGNALYPISPEGVMKVGSIQPEGSDPFTVTLEVDTIGGGQMAASMKVWPTQHTPQVGDWVYADSTTSDDSRYEYGKTCLGKCIWVNQDDPTDVRMAYKRYVSTGVPWGLCSSNWSGGLTLEDNPGYDVFDVPGLSNIGNSGTLPTSDGYLDDSNEAGFGFARLDPSTATGQIGLVTTDIDILDYPKGSVMPIGQLQTLRIVHHRNIILRDSGVGTGIPTASEKESEWDALTRISNEFVSGKDPKYIQFFFMPASMCYAFEPKLEYEGEILHECFKAHRWYCGSSGEIARIAFFDWAANQTDNPKVLSKAIFKQAIADGRFEAFGSRYVWTSSENSSTNNAWIVRFPSASVIYSYKYSTYAVRPLVAFRALPAGL